MSEKGKEDCVSVELISLMGTEFTRVITFGDSNKLF